MTNQRTEAGVIRRFALCRPPAVNLFDASQARCRMLGMLVVALMAEGSGVPCGCGQDSNQLPSRRTPLVNLIQKSLPSAVEILAERGGRGSGVVIHPDGFILTNNHVVPDDGRLLVICQDGSHHLLRLVARSLQSDLALVQALGEGTFTPLELGRSYDVLLGEPVIIIGHPAGLDTTVSQGIVSHVGRSGADDGPTSLQTDAGMYPGNSGAPLINARAQLLAVMAQSRGEFENIGFGVPVDQLRRGFPEMLSAETRYGFHLGLEVDTLAPAARVVSVASDSPAGRAGVQRGDVIRSIDSKTLRHGVDFYLGLVDRHAGQVLTIELIRGDEVRRVEVELDERAPIAPVEVASPQPGLVYSAYRGQWTSLPDFAVYEPTESGIMHRVRLPETYREADHFALRFKGYIKIPEEDLFTFSVRSDDGSQLYLAGQLVADNDGEHAVQGASGRVRLSAGFHPITVTYFEGSGEASLELLMGRGDQASEEVAEEALFHPADTAP